MILGSRTDQRYSWLVYRQIYIWRINKKFGTWREKNTSLLYYSGVLISPYPDQGRSSEARQERARFQQHRDASCHQVPHPLASQGAEGKSRHSDRNIRLFPSWSGQGLISTRVLEHFGTVRTPRLFCCCFC